MDPTKVKESLLDVGFSQEQADQILSGAPKIKEAALNSGLRHKSFDLESAAEQIEALNAQMAVLSQQLNAAELAKTAADAVAKAKDDITPKQDVYTLEDLQTAVQKGFTDALGPFVAELKAQNEKQLLLWQQVETLGAVAKNAQGTLNDLTGELPRALRQNPAARYNGPPVTTQPNVGAAFPTDTRSAETPGDAFAWVDTFVNDLV